MNQFICSNIYVVFLLFCSFNKIYSGKNCFGRNDSQVKSEKNQNQNSNNTNKRRTFWNRFKLQGFEFKSYFIKVKPDSVEFKVHDTIFIIFTLQKAIVKFFKNEKSKDYKLENILKIIFQENISTVQKNEYLSLFIQNYILNIVQFNKPEISLSLFIDKYKKVLNVLNMYVTYIKPEYTLLNRKINQFDDFFAIKYEKEDCKENDNYYENWIKECGYSNTFDFCKKGIALKKTKEKRKNDLNEEEPNDITECHIDNYPYYLIIYSIQNMEFFIENWYKKDGGFKNIKLYKYFYKIVGFIQVNKSNDDYNILCIVDNKTFAYNKENGSSVEINNINESEFVDLKKNVVVFLEFY